MPLPLTPPVTTVGTAYTGSMSIFSSASRAQKR